MTKRIGILTRHCYPNYGSILQAFALQSALTMLGATPTVIDYINDDDTALGLVRANLRISKKARSKLGFILYILIQTPTFLSMFSVFRRHQKRLLNLSDRVKDREGLSGVSKNFDLVIAGSDQIWNRVIDALDENYFLPFVHDCSQRFSYAASLGSAAPCSEDKDLFIDLIKRMHAVSVRESSSAKWILAHGINARADVDPVLLHGRKFWDEFAGAKRNEFKYILVYQLHKSDNFERQLKEVRSKMNLPVIRLSPDWKNIFLSGNTKVLISPEAFLSWIRDATCVVTDSFHGTVFSLKFGRPMYVIPPGKNSTRLTDVMAKFGLERLVIDSDHNQSMSDGPTYDSDSVEKLLDNQAVTSWKYLRDILEVS